MPLRDPNRLSPMAALAPLVNRLRNERGFEKNVSIEGRRIVVTYTLEQFFYFLYDRNFEEMAGWDIDTPPFEEMVPYLTPESTEALQRAAMEELGYTKGDLAADLESCPTGKSLIAAWHEFLNQEWRDFLIDDTREIIYQGGASPQWFDLERVRDETGNEIGVKIIFSEMDKDLFKSLKNQGLESTIRNGLDIHANDDDMFDRWEDAWQDMEYMANLTERFEPEVANVLRGLYRPRYKHDFRQPELGDWNR